jgi:hypothetical protein
LIELLTKRGGLEEGCSVDCTGGGDRAYSFNSSNFLKHFTRIESHHCTKIVDFDSLRSTSAEIVNNGIRYNVRIGKIDKQIFDNEESSK